MTMTPYQILRQQLGALHDATGFRDDPVDEALLEELVAAATTSSPAGFNEVPWRFVGVVGEAREPLITTVAEALARHWGLGSFGPRGLASDKVLSAPALVLAFSSLPSAEGLEAFGVVTAAVGNFILLAQAAGLAVHRIYSAHIVPEAVVDFVGGRLGPEVRRGELVAMLAVGHPLESAGQARSATLPPARLHFIGRDDPGPTEAGSADDNTLGLLEVGRPRVGLRATRGERVCVVDAYPYNRELLSAWLGSAGYQVSTHERGADLITWVDEHGEPDLYILSETPLDTTGFELSRRLRARETTEAHRVAGLAMSPPPIVVATSRLDTAFRIAGLAAGVDYYLRKPIHPVELYTVARILLERHRLVDQLRGANQELGRLLGELRTAQARLVQQAKMASLGQLVAGVAHEINTPLGAVVSNNDLFLRAFDRLRYALGTSAIPLSDQVKRDLDAVTVLSEVTRLACQRITGIVRSLRTFARLDEAEVKAVDLHEGIESTLVLIAHLVKERNVSIERHYGTLPLVECHPNQINQVFMNLLVNACQAIDGRGRVTVETALERIGDHERVAVAITDTGKGIPEADLERIFDPGFTTTGAGVGTGLGLSICYQIVQAHGGDSSVASTPGEGTTFRFELPLRVPAQPE
jgi:signal transduction histidine kinase/nitroreductase